MRISLNWVKEYLDFDLPPVVELVDKIGAQLGAVEEVIDLGAKYQGVVVAKVMECTKLESSDHLNVCRIDDGGITPDVNRDEQGWVQVVCGAPNVRQGLVVAWLPPGSTVPLSFGTDEPFVLSARELRGVVSNGMLASPKELALGDSHEGLLELTDTAVPGTSFAELYGLNDTIIDVENKMFTHRPDCFGQLGVAREVAGILGHAFKSPEWYTADMTIDVPSDALLPLTVRNEVPQLVPRFTAITVSGVKVGPSPVALQALLTRAGIRPISNIVDITNYYMLLTGQPLHAYDYDKVKALGGSETAELAVRNPRPSEKITLLNGKEIDPRQEAIMIATGDTLLGLGGVMGAANSEVDEHTTNIILECATFDMYSIRRTSMAHGIFTDAVSRFNKGQSPLQNIAILARILGDVLELAGGAVGCAVLDDNHLSEATLERQSLYTPVGVSRDFIVNRLGLDLSVQQMAELLQNVEFTIETKHDDMVVTAPFWRTDIELREDVVEEIGRLYGYDHLPLRLPLRSLMPAPEDASLQLKADIRSHLASLGANEVLTYSFVHGNLLERARQDVDQAYGLSNALSPDLQYYRLSIGPSLLEKVHANIKAGYSEFGLFELGKAHATSEVDADGLPREFDRLAFVFAVDKKVVDKRYSGAAYYQSKEYVTWLFSKFGVHDSVAWVQLSSLDLPGKSVVEQMLRPYDPNRTAVLKLGDDIVGVVGEYRSSVRKLFKLPDFCSGFELNTELLKARSGTPYLALPRFPKVEQDICLKVSSELTYGALKYFVLEKLSETKPENTSLSISTVDIYQREDDKDHKQITFRISLASYERTLTDKEVNGLLDTVAEAAATTYSAERV